MAATDESFNAALGWDEERNNSLENDIHLQKVGTIKRKRKDDSRNCTLDVAVTTHIQWVLQELIIDRVFGKVISPEESCDRNRIELCRSLTEEVVSFQIMFHFVSFQ